MRETMTRAWEHQAVVEGRRKDFYTKRNTRMSGMTGMTSNAPYSEGVMEEELEIRERRRRSAFPIRWRCRTDSASWCCSRSSSVIAPRMI